MKRDIITIDREKCNGCGLCVSGCHEGALQIIDEKAVLISELMCDGLGACIGECPLDAITIERREAEAYDEVLTISKMIGNGKNTVIAHLKHLKDYNQRDYLRHGVEWLMANRNIVDFDVDDVMHQVHNHQPKGAKPQPVKEESHQHHHPHPHQGGGCPGSMARSFGGGASAAASSADAVSGRAELTHWPIQLHLINPNAPHYSGSNLVLAADCVAFSLGNFHSQFLKGKTLAIACPKLDSNKEVYVEKIAALIDNAQIDTLTVMKMEVPCCGGLLQIARMAMEMANRTIPIKQVTVGLQGDILENAWA